MGLTTRLAALWGFLEATIFFIVPDVLLTYLASQKQQSNLRPTILAATLGALIGGVIMFSNGQHHYYASQQLMTLLPAIDQTVIAKVNALLVEQGIWGLFSGPLLGLPYKLFAIEAAALKVNLWVFLMVSVPARALRFIVLSMLARFVVTRCCNRLTQRSITLIWLCCWALFYLAYFSYFGW